MQYSVKNRGSDPNTFYLTDPDPTWIEAQLKNYLYLKVLEKDFIPKTLLILGSKT